MRGSFNYNYFQMIGFRQKVVVRSNLGRVNFGVGFRLEWVVNMELHVGFWQSYQNNPSALPIFKVLSVIQLRCTTYGNRPGSEMVSALSSKL